MTQIDETNLPGVGIRHDFETAQGVRVGVISHRSGRRDLLVYGREDPDACAVALRLDENDVHTLAELLGGTRVTKKLTDLQQTVEGLTLDWLPVSSLWACAGHTIGETQLRRRTGVSIVAVVRDGETTPSPTPDFLLRPGDTVVVVGTPQGIAKAGELMSGHLPSV